MTRLSLTTLTAAVVRGQDNDGCPGEACNFMASCGFSHSASPRLGGSARGEERPDVLGAPTGGVGLLRGRATTQIAVSRVARRLRDPQAKVRRGRSPPSRVNQVVGSGSLPEELD